MEHKETGEIILIKDLQTFPSGFIKREFVIETPGEYPQKIQFEVTKDKAEKFTEYNKVGDNVEVKFNVRGSYHEASDRYFVNLQSWHVQKLEGSEEPQPNTIGDEDDNPPF
jgi:hypothetical protein